MALMRNEHTHTSIAIRRFPVELQKRFKEKCKKDKKFITEVTKKLFRAYVDETKEMYITKEIKELPQKQNKGLETKTWGIKNFPIKLHADFKSCCAARGDKMVDALIYLIKENIENGG